MSRDDIATASTPTYTMGYGPDFRKLLERRNAAECTANLLPHLRPGMRLLDLGCGPGTISVGLADAVAPSEMHGIDMEPTQVEIAGAAATAGGHANARFRTSDAANLPFEDTAFDVAHCHALLNHMPDTRAVVAEAKRVLKPGGRCIPSNQSAIVDSGSCQSRQLTPPPQLCGSRCGSPPP